MAHSYFWIRQNEHWHENQSCPEFNGLRSHSNINLLSHNSSDFLANFPTGNKRRNLRNINSLNSLRARSFPASFPTEGRLLFPEDTCTQVSPWKPAGLKKCILWSSRAISICMQIRLIPSRSTSIMQTCPCNNDNSNDETPFPFCAATTARRIQSNQLSIFGFFCPEGIDWTRLFFSVEVTYTLSVSSSVFSALCQKISLRGRRRGKKKLARLEERRVFGAGRSTETRTLAQSVFFSGVVRRGMQSGVDTYVGACVCLCIHTILYM